MEDSNKLVGILSYQLVGLKTENQGWYVTCLNHGKTGITFKVKDSQQEDAMLRGNTNKKCEFTIHNNLATIYRFLEDRNMETPTDKAIKPSIQDLEKQIQDIKEDYVNKLVNLIMIDPTNTDKYDANTFREKLHDLIEINGSLSSGLNEALSMYIDRRKVSTKVR